jgi:hypothetical protein
LALRSRIVLACAEDGSNTAVAHRLGVDRNRQNAGRVITPEAPACGAFTSL